MKAQANKHLTDRNFDVGEMVFLKLKQHRQNSVVARIYPKLSSRYHGPFEILERISEVAYSLKLPVSSRIHPVFHVSILKKWWGIIRKWKNYPLVLRMMVLK